MASVPCDERGCRRIARCALLGSVIVCAGCSFYHGPRADRMGELMEPTGATVELRLHEADSDPAREISGELLEVQLDGVLLLTDRIMLITWDAIDALHARKHPLARRVSWGTEPAEAAAVLRPASRYPHGMHPTVLTRMLAALNQSGVVRVEP